jgi:hypothetical protein
MWLQQLTIGNRYKCSVGRAFDYFGEHIGWKVAISMIDDCPPTK